MALEKLARRRRRMTTPPIPSATLRSRTRLKAGLAGRTQRQASTPRSSSRTHDRPGLQRHDCPCQSRQPDPMAAHRVGRGLRRGLYPCRTWRFFWHRRRGHSPSRRSIVVFLTGLALLKILGVNTDAFTSGLDTTARRSIEEAIEGIFERLFGGASNNSCHAFVLEEPRPLPAQQGGSPRAPSDTLFKRGFFGAPVPTDCTRPAIARYCPACPPSPRPTARRLVSRRSLHKQSHRFGLKRPRPDAALTTA